MLELVLLKPINTINNNNNKKNKNKILRLSLYYYTKTSEKLGIVVKPRRLRQEDYKS